MRVKLLFRLLFCFAFVFTLFSVPVHAENVTISVAAITNNNTPFPDTTIQLGTVGGKELFAALKFEGIDESREILSASLLLTGASDPAEIDNSTLRVAVADQDLWGEGSQLPDAVAGQQVEAILIGSQQSPYIGALYTIDVTALLSSENIGGDGAISFILSSNLAYDILFLDTYYDEYGPEPRLAIEYGDSLNQPPTDISLSQTTVNQDAGMNAVVGTLSTTDADVGDTHTYTLAAGGGDDHNEKFAISGADLTVNDPLSMPAGDYSVRIRTTDSALATYEKSFTITVIDNVAPTFTGGTPSVSDVTKTGAMLTVRLNEPGAVYYVVVADEDGAPSAAQVKLGQNSAGDSALQSGSIAVNAAGVDATDNITGLTQGTAYDVYVVAEDSLTNLQSAAVKLDFTTTANQPPTAIGLSHTAVTQSAGANGVVGTLTTIDADAGDTHAYTLVAGAGDNHNGVFNINGDQLRANDASQLDAGIYMVRIRTTDNDGGIFEQQFSIEVLDDIAPPMPVIMSPTDGEVTSDANMKISGTAEAASTVDIYVNNALQGSATADSGGNWSYTPAADWPDGSYSVTAVSKDHAGNTSPQSPLIGFIVDTTPPEITLNGDTDIRIIVGTAYTDAGAAAWDDRDGDVTANIVVTNPVDVDVIDVYTVTYNVSDNAGNAAASVQRTVTVAPGAVTAVGSSNNAKTVKVSAAIAGATLTLYDHQHKQVGSKGTASDDGTFVFTGVPAGKGYYVTQTVNGIESDPSSAVDVTVSSSSSGSSSGSPSNQPAGTIRLIPIAIDGNSAVEQIEIVRKTTSDGNHVDEVKLMPAQMKRIVEKASELALPFISIPIDDLPDEPADEVTVTIDQASLSHLSASGMAIEIRTRYANIRLPSEVLQKLAQLGIDLHFRIAPVRDEVALQQLTERMETAKQVRGIAGEGEIDTIGTPVIIEANYADYPTTVIFPLTGIDLPEDPARLQQLSDSLAVYIEHSDGEKNALRGRIILDADGRPEGIEIAVSKFSTFAVFSFSHQDWHLPYVSGYEDGTFAPDRAVTRAELAAMLTRLLADRLQAEAKPTAYTDVAASHWAGRYIANMQQLALMGGYPDGTFRPDQPVTRAEFAHAIHRLLAGGQEDKTYAVHDIAGHWAYVGINRVLAAGVMSGYPDGTFRPNEELTRAEAVSSLNRLFDRQPLRGARQAYSDVSPGHWAHDDIMEASVKHWSTEHAE